jgi:hypothetical protein
MTPEERASVKDLFEGTLVNYRRALGLREAMAAPGR